MFAGIDTHKDTLAMAIVDHTGLQRGGIEVDNTPAGFATLITMLVEQHVQVVGIEGSGNYGRAVAVHLVLETDCVVVEVPPLLTARERSARPGQGKTDPVDALSIARITVREPDLPPVRLTVGPAADLRALLDYRSQLIHERSAAACRVHIELSGLKPGYQTHVLSLTSRRRIAVALRLLKADTSVRAELCRRRLQRMAAIDAEVADLTRQIAAGVQTSGTTLTSLYGVGPLVAGRFLAEIVDIDRYPTKDRFASANGTAPLAASSGRTVRHRLNRGGNRQLNRALYTMAITQIRADTEGRAYYLRKRAEGKTSREALRSLKRRLSDQIYKTMRHDAQQHGHQPIGVAA